MVELAGERSLDLELRTVDALEFRMLEEFQLDGLQRNLSLREAVAREINHRSRAAAERLDDVVLADARRLSASGAGGLFDLRLANDFLLVHPRAKASEGQRSAP